MPSFWNKSFWKKEAKAVLDEAELNVERETIEVPVVECDCRARQLEYVNDVDRLQKEAAELRAEHKRVETNYEKRLKTAKEELADLELKKKIELEDIQHMQRLLDEKNALSNERVVFEAQKEADEEIREIRKEYSDKLEKELAEERKKMQAFMEKVMAALPNVNVRMKGDMGG